MNRPLPMTNYGELYHLNHSHETHLDHPLMEAFQKAQHGQLVVNAPEGDIHLFGTPDNGDLAHLKIYDWWALDDFLARGEVGFAEAYMEHKWDTHDLPALLTWGLKNSDVLEAYFYGRPLYTLWQQLRLILNANTITGSKRNILEHYDLGNDFYGLWLDESMTYSSALFGENAHMTLEQAQEAKYRRILDKLNAEPGQHILEIGGGWAGFAEIAAAQGLNVTSITVSEEQKAYSDGRLRRAGVDHLAHMELKDYRQIEGMFDHIVSIGMFEHVGESFWPTYFHAIRKHLQPGGTAIVQTIALDQGTMERTKGKSGFIEHYIFPGGQLPTPMQFNAAAEKAGLTCREMFMFGSSYALTLMHWLQRFDANRKNILALGYSEEFIRMWRFYLASCIAGFNSGRLNVMQVELTHE